MLTAVILQAQRTVKKGHFVKTYLTETLQMRMPKK